MGSSYGNYHEMYGNLLSIQDLHGSKAGSKNNLPELCSGDFYARISHVICKLKG